MPSLSHDRCPVPIHHGGMVTGKCEGVKPDILDYLREAAKFFGSEIHINSGLRNPEDQARAMFGNWTGSLKRGSVYAKATLPEEKRARMDGLYRMATATAGATPEEKSDARAKFWAEATQVKSKHLTGDAVDLPAMHISEPMRKALEMFLKHVKEGGKRCYHLQRIHDRQVPAVTDALRASWQQFRDAHDPGRSSDFILRFVPHSTHSDILYVC